MCSLSSRVTEISSGYPEGPPGWWPTSNGICNDFMYALEQTKELKIHSVVHLNIDVSRYAEPLVHIYLFISQHIIYKNKKHKMKFKRKKIIIIQSFDSSSFWSINI